MTPALTLDEFTAALREAFPSAEILDVYTQNGRWQHRHSATLRLHGVEFAVSFNLNPWDTDKQWTVEHSVSSYVATAPELRALMVQSARLRAKYALDEARELADKAGKLKVAALRIEANYPEADPKPRASNAAEVTVTLADGTSRTVRVDE